MTLILCEVGDMAAIWAAERLRARGVPAELLFGADLGEAARWEHRVDATSASIAITFADGRVVSSESPRPILNRLGFVPLGRLLARAGEDYGYAVQELFAFYLSWLHAWPATVINRPSPQGLSGYHRHASMWASLAARAGLATEPWTQSSDDPPERGWIAEQAAEESAFVVAGKAVLPPALPRALAAPCRRLAALAETALIGVDFRRDGDGRWLMTGASPSPNLILGGEPLVDALAKALAS